VRRVPKVGGTKTVKLDAVRALAPTHVILNVDENRKETADALAEFVPNLVVTHPLGPLDNLALYRQFGEVFDRPREAAALCERFQDAYDAARATACPPRNVLYLIWRDPWMTVSRDTYISRTLAVFGMHTLPATSAERYPKLNALQAEVEALREDRDSFASKAETIAREGFASVVLDIQHGLWDTASIVAGIGALHHAAAAPVVRVPLNDFAYVSRALDFGAEGVIAPMINTAADAQAFVSATKFPPLGERSWGPMRAMTLTSNTDPKLYLREANGSTVREASPPKQ